MQRVDADAVLRPLERGDPGELVERCLGRRVGGSARSGRRHVLRADDDDAAAARRELEQRMAGLHHEQVGFHVHRHGAAPALGGDVLDRLGGGEDPRVQHQHVDAAEAAHRRVERCIDRLGIGQIAGDTEHIDPLPERRYRRIAIQADDRGATL